VENPDEYEVKTLVMMWLASSMQTGSVKKKEMISRDKMKDDSGWDLGDGKKNLSAPFATTVRTRTNLPRWGSDVVGKDRNPQILANFPLTNHTRVCE
jgi:hypothetical protein